MNKHLERRLEIEHKVMAAAMVELKDMIPNTEFVIIGYEQDKPGVNKFILKSVASMEPELAAKFLRIAAEQAEKGLFNKGELRVAPELAQPVTDPDT